MSLTEFEQYTSTQLIKEREYKRGVAAGKKERDKELRIEREKEIEGLYQAHLLRQEELAQERDDDIRADYHPRPEEENLYQGWKKSKVLTN